jgi:hypothetical protein
LLPAGALLDCLNTRLWPPLTHAWGLGKRAGLILAFQNAVGQAAAGPRGEPVTGAIRCTRAANQSVNLSGNYINVDDDFSDYAVPNLYGGTFYSGTDFKGRYLIFSHRVPDAVGGGTDEYAERNPATGIFPDTPFVPANATDPRTPGRLLYITAAPVSTTHNYGLAITYPTTNRIKASLKIQADPFGNTGADFPTPGSGQCTNLALFVRGSENLGDLVCAYIKATATDVVSLVIETWVGGVLTTYTSSETHNLARGPGPSVLSLEFVATTTSLSVRFIWGDQGIDETFTKSEATPGTTLATENRAGLLFRHNTTNIYRNGVTRLEYTTLVPLTKVVKFSIRSTDADPTGGRWQLPSGWDSVYVTNATIEGDSGAYSENGSTPTVNFPMIDKVGVSPASGAAAEAQVYGGQTDGTTGEGGVNNGGALVNRTRFMFPTSYDDTFVTAMTVTPDVELEWTDTDGTIDDAIGAGFRIDGISGTY